MNTQSPLVPQGSILEQKNKGRARVKVAVFLVLAFHGVGVLALLMTQGCKQDKGAANEEAAATNSTPTSQTQAFEQPSNPVVAPTNVAPPETNTAVATAPPPAQPQDYAIAQGDTLSGLAKKFGVSVKAIVDANPGIEPTKLKIGQKIHIPPAAPAAATAAAAPTTETTEGEQSYTVKSGDTLSSIAKQFGVRVRAIRNANSLTSDRIIVGQKLKIPAKTAATLAGTSAPPDTASPPSAPK